MIRKELTTMKNRYVFTAICTTELYGASEKEPRVIRTAEFTNKVEAKKAVRNRLSKGAMTDMYVLTNATTGEIIMSHKRKTRKPTAPWFDSVNPRG